MNNLQNVGPRPGSSDLAKPEIPAKNVGATSPLVKDILSALNSPFPGDQIKAIGVVWGKEEKSLEGFSETLGSIKKNFLEKAPAGPQGQNADTHFCLYVTKQMCQQLGPPLGPQIRQLLNKHQSADQTSNAAQPALLQKELGMLLDKMQEALVPTSGIDLSQCLEETGLMPAEKPEPPATNPTNQAIIVNDALVTRLPDAVSKFHNEINAGSKPVVANTPALAVEKPKVNSVQAHKNATAAALDCFPDHLKNQPGFKNVASRMDTYSGAMKQHRGTAQKTLIQDHPKAIAEGVASIKIYSNLSPEKANAVAFERELVNIRMQTDLETSNLGALGCEKSKIKSSKEARRPGNEVSVAMRTPIAVSDGKIARPVILSVSAPALDTHEQPEWNDYVKGTKVDKHNHVTKKGDLDAKAFKAAMHTLAEHIKQCANDNPGHRVVLSGYGLNNFIAGLSQADQATAKAAGITEMVKLVDQLAAKGMTVAFTGLNENDEVLTGLRAKTNNAITFTGSVPGDWIKDNDIIVNAWDPHSLVGNGCKEDNSMDGFVGRSSLTHEIHATACNLYAEGLLKQANQNV